MSCRPGRMGWYWREKAKRQKSKPNFFFPPSESRAMKDNPVLESAFGSIFSPNLRYFGAENRKAVRT